MPVVLAQPTLCTPLVDAQSYLNWKNSGSQSDPDTPADLGLIERVLCAATAWIESPQGCGRSFTLDPADVTRIHWPYEPGRLLVDDFYSVTSIALDTRGDRSFSTLLLPGDYLLWPTDGPPYQEIRSWSRAHYAILPGQMVQTVGRAGYVNSTGVAPAAVQLACLLLTNRWFSRRQSPFGVLELPTTGQFARIAQEDVDVKTLLAPYIHNRSTWIIV